MIKTKQFIGFGPDAKGNIWALHLYPDGISDPVLVQKYNDDDVSFEEAVVVATGADVVMRGKGDAIKDETPVACRDTSEVFSHNVS